MADLEGSNRKLDWGGGLLLKELKGLFFFKKKIKTNQARLARWFSS